MENRITLAIQGNRDALDQVPAQVTTETGSLLNLLDDLVAKLFTPSLKVSREEGLCELQRQLAALPADYRVAITLKDLQALSVDETAARMNRPVDEVRGLLYRGRKKLAEGMGNSSLYQFRK